MKIAICDDERAICEDLQSMMTEYFLSNNMTCTINTFETFEKFFSVQSEYDLVFLDYNIPGENGIDFAKRLRDVNKKIFIIFQTSFPEHVFESFSLDTFRYLIKPIEKELLFEALASFVKLYHSNRKIIIQTPEKSSYIDSDEVIFIEANLRYTTVHTTSGEKKSYKSISHYEAEINNPQFFRVHRAFIVNMRYVSEIERKDIRLTNGELISISPKKYDVFLKNYMNYLKYNN